MRIVQTCWACNHPDLLVFNAGWYGPEYHLMSWALSALQLRQYYSDVVLYADSASAAVLVDLLRLPYTEVYCELDDFRSPDPGLWALPKIYVYSRQERPFLHVDGDVFIWRPFDEALLASDLIAQNIETESSYYESLWGRLAGSLEFLPEEMMEERRSGSKIIAYNAGIFGGADIAFFKDYTCKAIEFVNRNLSRFGLFNASDLNELFEQYLFFCMAKQRKKSVNVLLPELRGGQQYLGLVDFAEAPYNKKYLHLLRPFKGDGSICELMANRLRMDYPEYYYRIISLFKKRRLSLKRDYYQGVEPFSETDLVDRHEALRDNFFNGALSLVDNRDRRRTFECRGSKTALVLQAVGATRRDAGQYVSDVERFEENISSILQERFSTYSSDYLYGRDLTVSASFQVLFGERSSGYAIALISEPGYEIISSQFDWSEIGPDDAGQKALKEQLELAPSTLYTAVIPEGHAGGYSLANIDDLDLQLLDVFKEQHTIRAALLAMESLFDEADLRDARDEFEELITGRIKWALKHKLLGIARASPK